MKVNLKNKKILVTGSSRGVGKAITKRLANCGAQVAAHYFNSEKSANELVQEFGNQIIPVRGDLGNPDETVEVFKVAYQKLNGLDVLINNAAIAVNSPITKDHASWLIDFHQTLQVNLTATALLCKVAIGKFVRNGGGRIINIASRAAFRGDTTEYWAYAASKGGMVSLTGSIARAFGKDGIVAFNIAPGFVKTDMADGFIQQYGEDMVMDDLALGELTTPEHIAPMVALLASGLADHATGTTIDINAGSYVH